MKNEYDCWFQKRQITTDFNLPQIIIIKGLQINNAIIVQAINEYIYGIKRLLGITPRVDDKPDFKQSAVFLGMYEKNDNFSAKEPSQEGFIIKVENGSVYISGYDERGLLYGIFRFLFLLSLNYIKEGFIISDSPVSNLRILNHWDNFDGSIERGYAGGSLFYKDGGFCYDNQRIEDYARLIASLGINCVSINNVNVRNNAKFLITEEYLQQASKLADILRPFGIRLLISVNFGAPWSLGKLPTADPLDPDIAGWWKERAVLIYKYIPDLAGFLVKADSEGEPGPFQYNRSHADGANMLAKAVEPFGGIIIWRCFVYNCAQDWRDTKTDRARASYDHFIKLDGAFCENVILQIKFGPYDFQVREPVSPLFGALKKTRHIMELQITQEYTGQQIDLCYLPFMWEDIMNFDTGYGKNSRICQLVSKCAEGEFNIEGFAAVANTGTDKNWTGHSLAQANLYGYGRMAWNPFLSAKEIANEWSILSFGKKPEADKITEILLKSYPAYEKYTAPFGICFMVTPGSHYGPCIEGYEFSRWGTYHRSDAKATGIDRTKKGTGYTNQYSKKNASLFSGLETCPENLILFFHRLEYSYVMKNGNTLLQNIYDTHFEGYDEAVSLLEEWKNIEDLIEKEVWEPVLFRFRRQIENALEWRDQINTYFLRKTGIPDQKGRKIF